KVLAGATRTPPESGDLIADRRRALDVVIADGPQMRLCSHRQASAAETSEQSDSDGSQAEPQILHLTVWSVSHSRNVFELRPPVSHLTPSRRQVPTAKKKAASPGIGKAGLGHPASGFQKHHARRLGAVKPLPASLAEFCSGPGRDAGFLSSRVTMIEGHGCQ